MELENQGSLDILIADADMLWPACCYVQLCIAYKVQPYAAKQVYGKDGERVLEMLGPFEGGTIRLKGEQISIKALEKTINRFTINTVRAFASYYFYLLPNLLLMG